ncbi:hypothetical protein K2173_006417 [Erythroxylum novogranatense]|uniref:CLAVATA3/ESR (CLE)-related protein 45 n=1 Tax=Erythroxylum novogranatense TaxID=1862640 RepID=A0AAV8U388_9ROSI|nr:hypothetical protein K2173_006417 [Erythroxylum novogranatense]
MSLTSARRLLFLIICIGSLAVQPDKAYCLTSIQLVLRQRVKAEGTVLHNPRILEDVTMQRMKPEKQASNSIKSFDPNQSSKRRVRRGQNPIHNRSQRT